MENNHAKGRKDGATYRDMDISSKVFDDIFGGTYSPPDDPKGKDQYDSGFENAQKNCPK